MPRVLALHLVCVVITIGSMQSQQPRDLHPADLYPESRQLIREGESAANLLSDSSQTKHVLLQEAQNLYARAGYLGDAARLLAKTHQSPLVLQGARLLYGDRAGAEKSLAAIQEPSLQIQFDERFANILWRMGENGVARLRLEALRRRAAAMPNLPHRDQILSSIDQSLLYVDGAPPDTLSAVPQLHKKVPLPSYADPLFPIATDGFRERTRQETADQSKADEDFLRRLYAFLAASDLDGLRCIMNGADSPFRRTLGLASMEHLCIQAQEPAAAEIYAMLIPEEDSDLRLAKAQALTFAGVGWSRANQSDHADADFHAASELVASVPDLPFGKITIMVAIAAAQSKAGFVYGSSQSFVRARTLTEELPVPESLPQPGERLRNYRGPSQSDRNAAYRMILLAAIQAHDLGTAHAVAAAWGQSCRGSASSITKAWLDADRQDEAIAFARQMSDPAQRASALFLIASESLNEAGAPNI